MSNDRPEEAGPRRPTRRLGPVHAVTRSVRRFARRPRGMQLRTLLSVTAVVAGTVAYVVVAPVAGGGSAAASSSSTSVSNASTSSRGVTSNTINVAFPVVSFTSLEGKYQIASDVEFGEQIKAIKFFVKQINKAGGINGRKINALIPTFDPTNAQSERALCENWIHGSPGVFAVVDGLGTWRDQNQLCVTKEGQTPLISAWSTVPNWTKQGAPYLWWTAPDQAVLLQAVVNWGLSSGLLGYGHNVGIIVGDRASDQAALNQYLLPDLQRAGVTNPTIETIAANTDESATTGTEAPLVVQKLKAAGVTDVIPLIPFNAFTPIVQAQTSQSYYPKLLLSDYESLITGALGLIGTGLPFNAALDGQEGVTTETLGGFDDARPQSQGGYDPGVRTCYTAWHKAYPNRVPPAESAYIEEQGPIQAWCTAIHLFATAAKNAGSNLNRRTFVEAMSKIKNFQGGSSPVWTFGPNKFYGPTQYQVVKLHNNVPPSSQCKLKTNGQPQGTCWVPVGGWAPLPS